MLKLSRRVSGKNSDFNATSAQLSSEIDAWVHEGRRKLGEILLDEGVLTADDLFTALEKQQSEGGRLGDTLVGLELIEEHDLARALSEQFQIDLADLRVEAPQQDAIELVGEELARKHTVIPLRIEDDGRVALVTGEPLGTEAIRELTLHCKKIRILVGVSSEINRMLDQAYSALALAQEHIEAFELVDIVDEENTVSLEVDENAPIVQVVNRILIQGVRARASDIHIEPHEKQVLVRFRIDGALSPAISLPQRMAPPLASRLKVMSDLNIVERRRPQDGQFSVSVDNRPIDVRISVVGTVHGEKIVLRLLDKTRSLISLDKLGMPSYVVEPYLEIVKAPLGMLLCTGPTGSGKTTTLYATLAQVADETKNVVTIEDPVEYQFDGINQMPVNEGVGISFADGLRGVLRQDPDVILVGEIRDAETARIATQAALTGHFVLSSLHAVDAVAALHRFTDMGIEPFLVASAISGVVGQRLMRRTCSLCREVYEPSPDHIALVKSQAGRTPDQWTRGKGCNMCSGTGFSGRVGVYELLQVTDAVRDLIVAKATAKDIRETAIAEGMHTMLAQACELVADGMTTVEDVLRNVYAPGMDDGASLTEADSLIDSSSGDIDIREGDPADPESGSAESSRNGTKIIEVLEVSA